MSNKIYKETKKDLWFLISLFGGRKWIRTTEVERRRIYSPLHLAALQSTHIKFKMFNLSKWFLTCLNLHYWSWWSELNQQPSDYKSDALPLSHTSMCANHKQVMISWCRGAESNHRHRDFQSLALPTELPRHKKLVFNGKQANLFGDPKRARTVDLQRDRLAL